MRIEPVRLSGEHVVLEPLSRGHLGPLCAVLDAKLLQWFTKPATNDVEMAEFIEEALHAQDAGDGAAVRDRRRAPAARSSARRATATSTAPTASSRSAGPGSASRGSAAPSTPRRSC